MGHLPPSHSTRIPWALGLGAVGVTGLAALALRRAFPPPETRLHAAGPDGRVDASPEGLARAAGVSLPAYALASMMQSEERTDQGRLAVGLAAWNASRRGEGRLVRLLLPRGRFGSQEVNPYASTARGPTARTVELARAVLAGRVPDFVEGAVRWDSPATQDRLHALYLRDRTKHPKYRLSSADVARRRAAEGYREVWVPGVASTRFWTRTA